MLQRLWLVVFTCSVVVSSPLTSDAATRTWDGGNDPWDGDIYNWNPDDEPDPDDDVVFNTNNTVDMAMDNEILSLTMSGDISLATVNYYLDVNGDVSLSGSGTRLRAGQNDAAALPATSLSAYSIDVGNGATFSNANFTSFIDPLGVGVFDIDSGGTLYGNGTIRNGDGISSPTVVFNNDGVIRPGNVTDGFILIGSPPPARTLTLAAIDGDARIDLDGTTGGGALDVQRNQTLDIDVEVSDDFDGVIDMSHNATLDIKDAWTFAGTLNVDNGLVAGVFPIPSVPADVAYLQGGQITMNESTTTINVLDGDGTLQIDAPFVADDGTINNNGVIVFNNTATINSGVDFDMIGIDAGMTVGSGVTVDINDADMDFDGSGSSTNTITVESQGQLNLNLDSFEGNDRADGVIDLNSGSLSLTVTDGSWTMDRKLNLTNTSGNTPALLGSAVSIGADTGSNDAQVTVSGVGTSQISVPVTWNSDTDLEVTADATLSVLGFSTFNSVNGTENATYIGPGNVYFSGGQVNETTTLDFSGGTVGLDSGGGLVILLSAPDFTIDAGLTINAAEIDEYGRSIAFPFSDTSELTINANVGGSLTVNLDNPADSWTVNDAGVMHVNGGNIVFSTFLSGSDLNMNGTMNVDGYSRSDARLTIGSSGTIDFVDGAANLSLRGGDLSSPNRLEGGSVMGPGELSAVDGRALHGHGEIGVSIDFDGATSELLADDGMLVVNPAATLVDVGILGTADSDGVLSVLQNWDTNVTHEVRLNGGELSGGTIFNNNANGVRGRGLVSAAIQNNSVVAAQGGGSLVLDNLLNTNDWDGGANNGALRAFAGTTLEIHDNAPFLFNGVVSAAGGLVRSNGFELEFDPGSTLQLEDGGEYRSTHATDIGGNVVVGLGAASRISVPGTVVFEGTSSSVLSGNLVLDNAVTRIQPGASFSGGGALNNPTGSTLVLADGADVQVLVQNDGTVALGNSPGQATAADFQQFASGVLEIELGGTALTDYDRMTLGGTAQLDGELALSLIGGFMPALDDLFTILSAPGGVIGTFALEDFSSAVLDPGLAWDVLYNPTNVQLLVVEENLLTADQDLDADVDGFDFLEVQRNDPSLIGDWEQQFGTAAPAAPAAMASFTSVPEPTSLLLLGVSLGGCLSGRPRRRGQS